MKPELTKHPEKTEKFNRAMETRQRKLDEKKGLRKGEQYNDK